MRKIKGFGSIGGAELHLIIVKEAGLDPRTTEKYSTFLKEQGIIRMGKGQEWIVDSIKIESLLALSPCLEGSTKVSSSYENETQLLDEPADNEPHSPD